MNDTQSDKLITRRSLLRTFLLAFPLAAAAILLTLNLTDRGAGGLQVRAPGQDDRPTAAEADPVSPLTYGALVRGTGEPANIPGAWPNFRGARRDGIAHTDAALRRSWQEQGPHEVWRVAVGEGLPEC